MNLKEIENNLIKLTELKNNAEKNITETYRNKWNVSKETRIARVDEYFYSINCSNFTDFKNILKNCKPYQNSHRIKHGNIEHDICSPFRFTIENGFYKRKLKFEFIKINNVKFWVSIDFKNIPETIKDIYFTETTRKLYDCESHYINIPSHYKRFKEYRVSSFTFCSNVLSWYCGDKTILDTEDFKQMLNEIKNI